MARFPRALLLYIAASSVYAALVFLAVHATYGFELGRAGVRLPDPEALINSIDTVSFVVWLGISLIAGTVLYRLASALEGERGQGQQRQAEIGAVFAMGQALAGSLELEDVAERFLNAAKSSLDPSVTACLYVHDETGDGFRLLLERGPNSGSLWAPRYSTSEVPGPIRARVIDHRQPLVLPDVLTSPAWAPIGAALTGTDWVRSFAALPLVSHDRLVGIAAFVSGRAGSITADGLQLVALVSQFVAASVRTSLSFREAERRADREAVVNRVAQRARASLDPDQVLLTTVEELGRALDVDRVTAALGTTPDALRATHEWTAPGVPRLASSNADMPAGRKAAVTGRTVQITDTVSRLATPIVVAGELAGVLSLHAGTTRDWSIEDVRLLEAVARELRVAMESARLFQARQSENERLLALQRASAVVATRSTTREVIDEVLRTASALLGQASASLYLWDAETGSLRLAQNADAAGHRVSLLLGRGHATGDLLARLEPVIVNDYRTWSGATPIGIEEGCEALLAVPLVRTGELRGAIVLRVYDSQTRFTLEDARLLSLFGDQAVAALTNAEAFERQRIAMEQLERVNRAKSEFVSIVSHEFRTPLTGIQGFSEMMRDEDLSLDDMKEYASDINKDAQRLNRMINEMLDLSRMQSGRMTLNREAVDLNAIVSDVVARLRPSAPAHPIALTLDPRLPQIHGDRDRLTQVIDNLLSNAVKYSPTGGEIVVTTASDQGEIRIDVLDHGMGIPPDALAGIWEQYTRVDSRDTKGIQGTGLGLPIVKQIVTLHGGRVWAESVIGRGSVFHVVFPLAASEQAVQA